MNRLARLLRLLKAYEAETDPARRVRLGLIVLRCSYD